MDALRNDRREYLLQCGRQDHEPKCLEVRRPRLSCRFELAPVSGLNAASNDLGNIAAIVQDERDQHRCQGESRSPRLGSAKKITKICTSSGVLRISST